MLSRDPGISVKRLLLDVNFKPEAARRICRALEPLSMMWVEVDMYDERALREVKDSTVVPICSGENLYGLREYRPYFEARSMDVAMIDVPWNDFAISKRIAALAESYELNVAPHNYYSHLSTLHSAHLCACVPNVRIMEIDIDDVPWKAELVTYPPVIERGELVIPTRPGWGADLNEDVARSTSGSEAAYPATPTRRRPADGDAVTPPAKP
jgi:L-alanine-DL-glutamate epimerase-like enolase superfamily enzyme